MTSPPGCWTLADKAKTKTVLNLQHVTRHKAVPLFHLLFGIQYAREVFQRKVASYMDDHLVIAITFQDHDFNVKATCERSLKKS